MILEFPELSLIQPCYNEEHVLEQTVPPLVHAFQQAGVELELVLVDNGSKDRTGETIERLIVEGYPVLKGHVPVNRGYGFGILKGIELSHGKYVGWTCADGQVTPADIVAVFLALKGLGVPALAKTARRTRQDGLLRRIISINYNILMKIFFHGIPSFDVNGIPKIMPAEVVTHMRLSSHDWFLDAEAMLKARHLGLPVVEIVIAGQPRAAGRSHVRLRTTLEFMRNILRYRFSKPLWSWSKQIRKGLYRADKVV